MDTTQQPTFGAFSCPEPPKSLCWGHGARLLQLAVGVGAAASRSGLWLSVQSHQAHHRLLSNPERRGPRPAKRHHRPPYRGHHTGEAPVEMFPSVETYK